MNWTKEKFIAQFGEDPEDLFGPDWEDYIADIEEYENVVYGNKFGRG